MGYIVAGGAVAVLAVAAWWFWPRSAGIRTAQGSDPAKFRAGIIALGL